MRKRTLALAIGVVAATVMVVLAVFNLRSAPGSSRLLRPDDARLVALGQKVYGEQCATCHGQRLEGQPNWRQRGADGLLPAPPHDASGHTWHHTDDLLFRITKDGVGKAANLPDYASAMPAYAGRLSDEEIIAALSWINAQWPPELRARVERMNAEALQQGR